MDISIERTFDVGLVYAVISSMEDAFQDGANLLGLASDVINTQWFTLTRNGKLTGVINFRPEYINSLVSHAYILKTKRIYVKELSAAISKFGSDNMAGKTIVTPTPSQSRNVQRFLELTGMVHCGTIKNAWVKHGQTDDIKLYSIEVK